MTRSVDDLAADVREGWRDLRAALIAVKGHLDEPYPDDPRWTPWTRFVERALVRLDAPIPELVALVDTLTQERDAAVEALLEAAKTMSDRYERHDGFPFKPECDALAAAVRRVETGQHPGLENAVGPAPTDPAPLTPFESSAKPGITTGSTQKSVLDSREGWRK